MSKPPVRVKPRSGDRVHLARAWTTVYGTRYETNCGLYYRESVVSIEPRPGKDCKTCHGHHLRSEGRAYRHDGTRSTGWPREGHAVCGCGAISPSLPSTAARKRWHREHKTEMAADVERNEAP